MHDVFISYARKDGLDFAEQLERDLTVHQYKTWRDRRNLDVYQDFTAEIEIGIREAHYVVVCVSPSIEQNPYGFVRREISYARSKNKPIIPLVLPNADLPLDIINLTWIGCFEGQKPHQTLAYDRGFGDLLARLRQSTEPGSRAATDADPYREYTEKLYDGIVDILDQTIIRFIDVSGQASPEVVRGKVKKPDPLAAFRGRYGMKAEVAETPISSFREAYERYEGRVLLLGEPGAGKSTTLLAFARDAAAARLSSLIQPLPVMVRCATWDSQAQPSIVEWISKETGISPNEMTSLLQTGKAILLLDALDELGSERTERKKTPDGREIEERYDPRQRFLSLLPDNMPLILSCRVKDYAGLETRLPLNGAVTLQPLTDRQIEDYLDDFPELWNSIRQDKALLDVARTPLLLSFIAFAFRDAPSELTSRGILSGTALRNFIFERYVHERYDYEKNRNESALPFTLKEVYNVLGHVAMINASGDVRRGLYSPVFENILMKKDFAEIIGQASRVVGFIEFTTHLRLLIPIETIFYTMRFIHLLLRDYFVYMYCLSNLENLSLYTEYYEPNPAKALGMIADDTIVEKLAVVLNDPQKPTQIRDCVALALGIAALPSAVSPLLQALKDPHPSIRYRAAEALGKLREASAVKPLQNALQDTDTHVRISAIHALGEIGTNEAIEVLQKALADTTLIGDWVSVRVCDIAVISLNRIGNSTALQIIQDWMNKGGGYPQDNSG